MNVAIESMMIIAKIHAVDIEKIVKKHTDCYYNKKNSPAVFFDYGPISVAVSSPGVLISNGAKNEADGILSINNTIKKLAESGSCDGIIEQKPQVSSITCNMTLRDDALMIDLSKILKNNESARTNRAFHSVVVKLSGGATAQIYKNGTIVCVAIKDMDSIANCVEELKAILKNNTVSSS